MSIILKAEASIDLDEHRKVWIEISAKPSNEQHTPDLIAALGEAVVDAALQAYSRAVAKRPEITRKAPDLTTFGDDDDDN
jgi:hypothetical protein